MDKRLQNHNEELSLEVEKLDENDDISSLLDMREVEQSASKSSDSLDDLLRFDAQVFVSNSVGGAHISHGNELLEKRENQQDEVSSGVIGGDRATSEEVTEIKWELDEFVDADPEPAVADIEQYDSGMNSDLPHVQDKRILQLESELFELKKMLEGQVEAYKSLEVASHKFKKINIFSLFVAVFALLVSFWLGILVIGMPVELGEQKSLLMNADNHRAVSVIEPEYQKKDDLQFGAPTLGTDFDHLVTTFILPEGGVPRINAVAEVMKTEYEGKLSIIGSGITRVDVIDNAVKSKEELIIPVQGSDISGLYTTDEVMKLKENTKAPVSRWVVNLNSYEQRRDTDKKMEELREKGIPVEMIIVNVGGVRWFRIRVTDFKTKAEAEHYAAKIKETLNSDHAWVSRI